MKIKDTFAEKKYCPFSFSSEAVVDCAAWRCLAWEYHEEEYDKDENVCNEGDGHCLLLVKEKESGK
jgi:hypothetical protein